jgi:hypothetical protein
VGHSAGTLSQKDFKGLDRVPPPTLTEKDIASCRPLALCSAIYALLCCICAAQSSEALQACHSAKLVCLESAQQGLVLAGKEPRWPAIQSQLESYCIAPSAESMLCRHCT